MRKLTLMERAFEMARSGDYGMVSELADALRREGYEAPRMHLSGRSLQMQLRKLIKVARELPVRAQVAKADPIVQTD